MTDLEARANYQGDMVAVARYIIDTDLALDTHAGQAGIGGGGGGGSRAEGPSAKLL